MKILNEKKKNEEEEKNTTNKKMDHLYDVPFPDPSFESVGSLFMNIQICWFTVHEYQKIC